MEYEIREMKSNEYSLLNDFLYEAIFIPKGVEAPPKSIIMTDDLQVYVKEFGNKKDDKCFVAVCEEKIVGAVWVRIMDDYGNVDEDTPSFAISLLKDFRGYGIGTMLMKRMLKYLKKAGYEKCSLAVQKENYAVKMYLNVGFKIVEEKEQEYIMVKKFLTEEQKKLDIDLWIIILVTMGSFLLYALCGNQIMSYVKNVGIPVLYRLFVSAIVQFSVAGLGITIVCILRKEKFSSFGLHITNSMRAVLGTVISFLPYICYVFASGQFKGYSPLDVLVTKDIIASGFPISVLGGLLIMVVWGFFEGFNYTVICDKINRRYPSKYKWIDYGAITCAIACLLLHPFSISFWGIIEILTTFVAIYGMLMVKKRTNNAWGCVFAFCFIWNAI